MEIQTKSKKYCNSLSEYSRYLTRVVHIGDIPLGSDYPIRIQSMTTTDTMNTNATVEQSIRIIEAGADYVRITAPSMKEATNLENIKKALRVRGYSTPLIADIHFTPNAAEHAARIVEKVRVNPGNYADRKRFKIFQYTDEMYQSELERIRERFIPLIKVCKEYGTAMRIGTNHGSLSDRIMNRYGDTPLGMVESALEFVRICEDLSYYEIVLSMKASNPKVMVQAYRLLVNKMEEEGMNYPLHLGVTEAGDGIDGRIKSAVGMGALLEDGIGDTVRVSLTEEPEAEVPVAIALVKRYSKRESSPSFPENGLGADVYNPFDYRRRLTSEVDKIGLHHVPVVILAPDINSISSPDSLKDISYSYIKDLDKWNVGDTAPDFLYLGDSDISYNLPGTLKKIFNHNYWKTLSGSDASFPLFQADEYLKADRYSDKINFVKLTRDEITDELLEAVSNEPRCVLILHTKNPNAMADLRSVFVKLIEKNINTPVIINRKYENLTDEELMLYGGTDFGGLLVDGFGDGIWLDSSCHPERSEGSHQLHLLNQVSFVILQAARTRISRTEYIACPSCGRTQFDLQETTSMIRSKTSHLKGIKIAVMGCIVNGPGEMADADYGFVGSGPGWVTLYRGKDVIERGIPYENALDKLIDLMKEDGNWISTSNV